VDSRIHVRAFSDMHHPVLLAGNRLPPVARRLPRVRIISSASQPMTSAMLRCGYRTMGG
jgi:hypothetical protein